MVALQSCHDEPVVAGDAYDLGVSIYINSLKTISCWVFNLFFFFCLCIVMAHSVLTWLSHFKGSFKCHRGVQPSFPAQWRIQLSNPHSLSHPKIHSMLVTVTLVFLRDNCCGQSQTAAGYTFECKCGDLNHSKSQRYKCSQHRWPTLSRLPGSRIGGQKQTPNLLPSF